MLHTWDLTDACPTGGVGTQGASEVTWRRAGQVCGFGEVNIIMDNAPHVRFQLQDPEMRGWVPLSSLERLLAEHRKSRR